MAFGLQPLGDVIGPAVVGVDGRAGAVGDGIAEEDDRVRVGLRRRQNAAQEQTRLVRAVRLEIRVLRLVAGRGNIGGLRAIPMDRGDARLLRQLTATLDKGLTERSTGSLTSGAPGGMTAEVCPPNVTGFSVAGSVGAPPRPQ